MPREDNSPLHNVSVVVFVLSFVLAQSQSNIYLVNLFLHTEVTRMYILLKTSINITSNNKLD